jgi:hypothetical protein
MLTFDNLEFEKTFGGVGASHMFDNNFSISVQAGSGAYSTPRENLSHPDEYSSFEVAIVDGEGNWATKDFIPNHNNDVMGWVNREEISALMIKIQSIK